MSFIGTIQTGPGADSYRKQSPAVIAVPASSVLSPGTPLRRNYLAIQGQPPGSYNFSGISPSLGLTGGDQAVLPTSVAGGLFYGVYSGRGVNNLTGASTALKVTPYVTTNGVQYTLVGAVSGGSAVTVGSIVQLSTVAVGTAATNNFATTSTTITPGQTVGIVCGYAIATTFGASGGGPGSASFYPPNIAGFSTTQAITVNPGGPNQETVTPSAVTAGSLASITATFTGTSATAAGNVVLTFASVPGVGTVGVTTAVTSGQTPGTIATNVAAALNSQFNNYGAAPGNILGIGFDSPAGYSAGGAAPGVGSGVQPFGNAQVSATSVVNIAAAIPGTALNGIAVTSATVAGITLTMGAASMAGGTVNSVTATFLNSHVANEPIQGTVTVAGSTILAVPTTAGGANIALAQVALTSF